MFCLLICILVVSGLFYLFTSANSAQSIAVACALYCAFRLAADLPSIPVPASTFEHEVTPPPEPESPAVILDLEAPRTK